MNEKSIATAQRYSYKFNTSCCVSKIVYCRTQFLFLQTPLPKLWLSQLLHILRSRWYCCRQKRGCRLQQRSPSSPREPIMTFGARLFFWLPWRHVLWAVIHPPVLPSPVGPVKGLFKIAVFLFHFLEALAVWGRLLGYMLLLDAFHGHAGARAGYQNIISWV